MLLLLSLFTCISGTADPPEDIVEIWESICFAVCDSVNDASYVTQDNIDEQCEFEDPEFPGTTGYMQFEQNYDDVDYMISCRCYIVKTWPVYYQSFRVCEYSFVWWELEEDGTCLSPESTITILNDQQEEVESKLKDVPHSSVLAKVLVESENGVWETKFEKVVVSHSSAVSFKYYNITTGTGKSIVMTQEHTIPMNDCCDYQTLYTASQVCSLLNSGQNVSVFVVGSNGNLEKESVAQCNTLEIQGAADVIPHNTMDPVKLSDGTCEWKSGGKIIVNNIVASHQNMQVSVHEKSTKQENIKTDQKKFIDMLVRGKLSKQGNIKTDQKKFIDMLYDETLLLADYVDLDVLLLDTNVTQDLTSAMSEITAIFLQCQFNKTCEDQFLNDWFQNQTWKQYIKDLLVETIYAEDGSITTTPSFAEHYHRERDWFMKMKNGACERRSLSIFSKMILNSHKLMEIIFGSSVAKAETDMEF